MRLSGFTFIHNAIEAGYPIVEAISMVVPFVDEIVVVDMESTDGTVELIQKRFPKARIIPGSWEPGTAGECLKKAHAQYKECEGDVIIHFEADEVYDYRLMQTIANEVKLGVDYSWISVYRLQVEQNFQRVRWYPEAVHRVFPKNSGVIKNGHTTDYNGHINPLSPSNGFLWDVTNCFRDNCIQRFKNQAELWGHATSYKFVPIHSSQRVIPTDDPMHYLQEPHWTWKYSPFNLPPLLRRLVGITNYGEYWDVS